MKRYTLNDILHRKVYVCYCRDRQYVFCQGKPNEFRNVNELAWNTKLKYYNTRKEATNCRPIWGIGRDEPIEIVEYNVSFNEVLHNL